MSLFNTPRFLRNDNDDGPSPVPEGDESHGQDEEDPGLDTSQLGRELTDADERFELARDTGDTGDDAMNPNVTSRTSSGSRPPLVTYEITGFHVDEPGSRTPNEFVRAALRQSIGTTQPDASTFVDAREKKAEEERKKKRQLQVRPTGPVIDGRALVVRSSPRAVTQFVAARQWNKLERLKLAPDVRLAFTKAATGYVLGRANKLNVPKISASTEDQLAQVMNLQSQLKVVRQHWYEYDIIDVATVVVPVDLEKDSTLEKDTYDLLTDYPQLHVAHVANSNVWYQSSRQFASTLAIVDSSRATIPNDRVMSATKRSGTFVSTTRKPGEDEISIFLPAFLSFFVRAENNENNEELSWLPPTIVTLSPPSSHKLTRTTNNTTTNTIQSITIKHTIHEQHAQQRQHNNHEQQLLEQ